jgi:hypothetical protein
LTKLRSGDTIFYPPTLRISRDLGFERILGSLPEVIFGRWTGFFSIQR